MHLQVLTFITMVSGIKNCSSPFEYNGLFAAVPGKVQNLVCAKSSSPTELSFSWELPTMLGEEVVDYRVEVKELRHRTGTRDVEQFDVDGYNTGMKETTVNQGLGS